MADKCPMCDGPVTITGHKSNAKEGYTIKLPTYTSTAEELREIFALALAYRRARLNEPVLSHACSVTELHLFHAIDEFDKGGS